MTDRESQNLICVAAIAGAFGVRGEVKIKPFTEDPKACLTYGPFMDERGRIILTPLKSRSVKNALAVFTKEVETREDAEALKSTKLYVPRSAMPEPDDEEFYHADLIGLTVETVDGDTAGEIVAVHDFGAGDMLEIKPDGHASFFHPFTKIAVPTVDIKNSRVVIVTFDTDEEE